MSTADELRTLEERLLQSDFRRNREAVSDLLADDFREFGSSGRVWNKTEILDLLGTEATFRVTLQNFHAIELASGAFLLTYTTTEQHLGTQSAVALRSSIWIMRAGRWQIIFHQGTRTNERSSAE